jgi:8-oxo-dGTP pyrophosphatase MutT (NUDIX family)
MSGNVRRVADALIPLSEPPSAPGWNHAAIADWLGSAPLAPAAVLIGVREGGEEKVIFTRRHDGLAKHAGQVAFPGGSMDADDGDMVDTALRETEEEIGLPRESMTALGYLDCFETISGFCITPVVARIAADAPPLTPNAEEVADVFEVPLAFFLRPDKMMCYTMSYRGRARPMIEYRYGGYRIWGATAAMLSNLLQRMGESWIHAAP